MHVACDHLLLQRRAGVGNELPLVQLLSKLGYEVEAVESAEDAFSFLENEKFPVIITDLIMLEMDGVEFCRRIRETDNKTFVIALTGHTELYNIDRLKEAGFDNHLTKPFKMEVIKQAINDGFEEFRKRAAVRDDFD